MTGWTRQGLVIAAEQYAGGKTRHLLFKTKAVPPPWSKEPQHGMDLPLWDNELSQMPDALIFVIEKEPEPALLVQSVAILRRTIDHHTVPSKQFPDGGVFWLRSVFNCLIGTPSPTAEPEDKSSLKRQLELRLK